jgi:multicomponent Na+:H+ antiporter subunit C
MGNFPFVVAMLLVILGLYTLLFKRNLIKLVIGTSLIETGVNLFLVALGYRTAGIAPIYTYAPPALADRMVLPTPQALTLTSIVIGLATTALLLSFAVVIHRHYGTLDVREVKELKG